MANVLIVLAAAVLPPLAGAALAGLIEFFKGFNK